MVDLDAAVLHARRLAVNMGAATLLRRRSIDLCHRIDVTNGEGNLVASVKLGDALGWATADSQSVG